MSKHRPQPGAQPLGSFLSPGARPPDKAAGDSGKPYRPSRLATASTTILVIGLAVSLGLHAGLFVAAANRTFGFVDPGAFEKTSAPVRIKRADFDVLIPPGGSGVPGEHGPQEAGPDATPDALTELLETPPTPAAMIEAELDLRPLDDRRPAEAASELAIEAPGFEIDPALLETLAIDVPEEADFTTGTGLAGRVGDATSADDLTAALLASSVGSSSRTRAGVGVGRGYGGGAGAATGSGLALLNRPELGVRPREPFDRRNPTSPPPSAEIDFAAMALSGTTQLDIPEKLDDDFDYRLSVFRDPKRPADAGYFRVEITGKRSLRKLQTMPKDLVFLVDISSSMPQAWVEQVALGVEQSLAGLNPEDRFNLVLFNDTVRFLADQPVPATQASVELARVFLRDAKSKGYTDVNAAMRRLLRRDLPAGRVYTLVLVSDGKPTVGVVDARDLINLITRENDRVAGIYCVGVGERKKVEPRLLDFLAYRNKGFSTFVHDRGAVAGTIRDLASRLRYPLIKDVSLRVAGGHVGQVYPVTLPTIHQGERFAVYGRYDAAAPITMQIAGRSATGRAVDFTFTREPAEAPDGGEAVAAGWAFWKLHHLYSEMLRLGTSDKLVNQVRALRERYGIETLY